MTFHVEVSARAKLDLKSISEHAPRRCALARENDFFPFEVRHLLYGSKAHVYRILFTVRNDAVIVLRIRHGRQLPAKAN